MHEYRLKYPTGGFFVLLAFAITAIVLALFTDPTFMNEYDLRDFSTGRWATLVLSALVALWCIKSIVMPKTAFYCDQLGVYIPELGETIDWQHVTDIVESKLKTGTSSTSSGNQPIISEAVSIRFDDSITFKTDGWQGGYARATATSTYAFSTGLTRQSSAEVIARLNQIREKG